MTWPPLFLLFVVSHLAGDYLLQTDWGPGARVAGHPSGQRRCEHVGHVCWTVGVVHRAQADGVVPVKARGRKQAPVGRLDGADELRVEALERVLVRDAVEPAPEADDPQRCGRKQLQRLRFVDIRLGHQRSMPG
jgi:hypothetical protein